MVGVYGPRQGPRSAGFTERGVVNGDVKYANFATPNRTLSQQTSDEKELSAQLSRALESTIHLDLYPKAVIDVYCTVLESGGADISLVTTTATAALANAGVAMSDILSSCCIAKIGERLLLDPNADEERMCDGHLLLSILPSTQQVAQVMFTGNWPQVLSKEALQLATEGCLGLDSITRTVLRETVCQE